MSGIQACQKPAWSPSRQRPRTSPIATQRSLQLLGTNFAAMWFVFFSLSTSHAATVSRRAAALGPSACYHVTELVYFPLLRSPLSLSLLLSLALSRSLSRSLSLSLCLSLSLSLSLPLSSFTLYRHMHVNYRGFLCRTQKQADNVIFIYKVTA